MKRGAEVQQDRQWKKCNGPLCQGNWKKLEEFYRNPNKAERVDSQCKECRKQKEKAKTTDGFTKVWFRRSERLYGISRDEIKIMVKKQRKKCPICRKRQGEIILGVDHCHTREKVRGLVCNKCNMAIGYLGDCPENCIRAARYLRRSQKG